MTAVVDEIPLAKDAQGVYRVSGTRVSRVSSNIHKAAGIAIRRQYLSQLPRAVEMSRVIRFPAQLSVMRSTRPSPFTSAAATVCGCGSE